MVVLWKSCRYLRFTQTHISTRFQDGRDITELIQDLVCDTDAAWQVKLLRVFFLNDMCFSFDNRRLACFILAGRFLGRELKVRVQTVSIRELSPFQLRKCRTAVKSMLTVGGRIVHLRRRTKVCGKTVRIVRQKITHCICLVKSERRNT